MSVKIRLKRMGSKKRPFYRIVAADSRNARDGRFIETLGYYNPMTDPADVNIKEDLVFKWMERGAQPSKNTESILRNAGVIKKWSLLKTGVSKDELENKYEELRANETPPLSAAERSQKAEAKKAETQTAEAESVEPKAAAPEASAEPEKTPETEAATEASGDEPPSEEGDDAAKKDS